MASFRILRTPATKHSDVSEGIRMSGVLQLVAAALIVIAAGTVVALSELATHRGMRTVHSFDQGQVPA